MSFFCRDPAAAAGLLEQRTFAGILLLSYRNSGPLPGYSNRGPLPGSCCCCWATRTEDLCRDPAAAAGLLEQRTFAGILLLLLGYRNRGPLPGYSNSGPFLPGSCSCCWATGTEDLCWATRTEDLCRDPPPAAGLPEHRTFAGLLLRWSLLSLLLCQSRHGRRPRPEVGKTQPCCACRCLIGRGLPHP